MVKFLTKDFVSETTSDAGVMVIDVDLQGAWEEADHYNFRMAFPNIYNAYLRTCLHDNKNKVGTSMLFEEGNYKVALLFTKKHRKDSVNLLVNFEKAVMDLFRLVPSDVFIYSPILGRADKCFNEMERIINDTMDKNKQEANRNWFVCRLKG